MGITEQCAAGECELNTVSGTAMSLAEFWVNSLNDTWAAAKKSTNSVQIASSSLSQPHPTSDPATDTSVLHSSKILEDTK